MENRAGIVEGGREQKDTRDDNPMRILDNKRGTREKGIALIIFAPRARSGTTVLKSVRN